MNLFCCFLKFQKNDVLKMEVQFEGIKVISIFSLSYSKIKYSKFYIIQNHLFHFFIKLVSVFMFLFFEYSTILNQKY